MVLMNLPPLSAVCFATFPHVLSSSRYPAVPNPILESQVSQGFPSFPTKPFLALEFKELLHMALKPSLSQLRCKEAWEPIRLLNLFRPSEVAR